MKWPKPDERGPLPQGAHKHPLDWVTGRDRQTPRQRAYLKDLCRKTGERYRRRWNKAEACLEIDRLLREEP